MPRDPTIRTEETPASIKPIQVPVSVPAVWNAARLQCVQTNCLTSNSLTRNVGEVLGVFGDSETYKDPSGRWRVRSTAKVRNLYALEEALDWVESPKWSSKFPSPKGNLAGGAKAFATHCQRCHARPYLDKFSAQWDAVGENWSGRNAPSDLADHFVAEEYLGQTRYVWKVTRVGFETVGTDDQFIKAHAGSRYTLNPRATEILDAKMHDGILATLREKVGGLASLLAARLAGARGPRHHVHWTSDCQRGIRQAQERSTHQHEPSAQAGRFGDDVDSPGGVDCQRRGLLLPQLVPPDRETGAGERDKFAFFRARPQPPTLAQMAVFRARPLNGIAFTAPYGHNGAWPTLESVLFPETRPESFWVGHGEFDPFAVGVDIKKGDAICGVPNRPSMCFKVTTTEHGPGTDDSGNSRSGHAGARF